MNDPHCDTGGVQNFATSTRREAGTDGTQSAGRLPKGLPYCLELLVDKLPQFPKRVYGPLQCFVGAFIKDLLPLLFQFSCFLQDCHGRSLSR
jgi:hypothetical protein